ncbi:MAG TPA: apolipoprotein N-acyltransferase [Chlamydiales bacterium]|nr:apolipoprotein N-acyltransferase [Chlamydiales bacterium]
MRKILFYFFSFCIVAFGEYSSIPFLTYPSYLLGLALFWFSLSDINSSFKRFALVFMWIFFVEIIHFSWVSNFQYHGMYIVGLHLVLATLYAVRFSIITYLFVSVKKVSLLSILMLASAWALMEWSGLFFFSGEAWDHAGLVMAYNLYSLQLASFVGIYGLSFYVILVNGMAYRALKNKKGYLSYCVVAILPFILGKVHVMNHMDNLENASVIKAMIVQPSFYPSQKNILPGKEEEFLHPIKQWASIWSYMQSSYEESDLILLPESTITYDLDQPLFSQTSMSEFLNYFKLESDADTIDLSNSFYGKALYDASKKDFYYSHAFLAQLLTNAFDTPMIMGADITDPDNRSYNAAFYFAPQKVNFERYNKERLVPFGEYLPFNSLREKVKKYGLHGFYSPGAHNELFLSERPIGCSICVEEIFSDFMREKRKKGAELFVNLTNDSWFPDSKLSKRHLMLGRVRSVENGLPAFRACNTGSSGAIDAIGRFSNLITQERDQGAFFSFVSSYHYSSFYAKWGNVLIVGVAAGILLIGILFWGIRFYFCRKRK